MELRPGHAHIWTMALDVIENDDEPAADATLFRQLEAVLSDDEITRANRFAFDNNRREYVAAHALCRIMLSTFAKTPARDWQFEVGPHGRPEIVRRDGVENLRFNISHTRGLVCVAVTQGHDIGVDVEWTGRKNQLDDIARAKFSTPEVARLAGLQEPDKAQIFFSFWTLKEAYIKAIGKGLAEPLDGFAFSLDPLGIQFLKGQDDPEDWHFDLFAPVPQYLCALALNDSSRAALIISRQSIDITGLSRLVNAEVER